MDDVWWMRPDGKTQDGPAELWNIQELCVDASDVPPANSRIIFEICATNLSAKNLEVMSL